MTKYFDVLARPQRSANSISIVPTKVRNDGGTAGAGFLDRTRNMLLRAWRDGGNAGGLHPDLPEDDLEHVRGQIVGCLDEQCGDVTVRARAADLGRAYLSLSEHGRLRFFRLLAAEFGVDQGALDSAIANLRGATNGASRAEAEYGLRRALQPARFRLFRQFNGLYNGVKFLVDMRADLTRLVRTDPALQPLDSELRDLLASWFDVGFLELRRITWDAPATLLEKLIAYEAVHEIRSWDDLKNRLDSDRRCYAFFHPNMPDEPLIFVEVALVEDMARDVHSLLDETAPQGDPNAADTAIFYSISNAQPGLAGVSFGNFLIKQVVADLAAELPNVKTFATLSPVPGFLGWLAARIDAEPSLLTPAESKVLAGLAGVDAGPIALLRFFERPDWSGNSSLAEALRPMVLRLCARCLLERGGDLAAHFHLANGARIERINWLADRSPRGLEHSAGIMVNYLYDQAQIEANHEAYRGGGKVAASPAVRALL